MGKRSALILAVVLASCLTACGGGSSASTDRSPLTMSEFIDRADAICRAQLEALKPAIDAVAAAFEEASSPGEIREVAAEAREVAARMRVGLNRLRDLPPPPEKREAITAMLAVAYAQAREHRGRWAPPRKVATNDGSKR